MEEKGKEKKFRVFDIGYSEPEKKKILVVDDDPSVQSLVFDTVGDQYRIFAAGNGREAEVKAERINPDLILMDVMMPDIGGYDAIRILNNNQNTKHIPVVMVTAMDFDPSTVNLLKEEPNVKGFLMKPFRPKQLREIIAAHIGD